MKSFEPDYIKNLKFPPTLLSSLRAIGECKGKEKLYENQSPEALEKLLENVIIQSTESSNRIEGVVASHKRIKLLVQENTKPKNRPEQEIAGYKDVLNLIHQSHTNIPLTENVILQFHAMLFRYTTRKSGKWKQSENEIVDIYPDGTKQIRFKTVSSFDTPQYMTNIISIFDDCVKKEDYDPLILVPLFVFDFLCIHPFDDGNGRVGRLLTLLLLYRAGYHVGKYISLERIIEESKESYYKALKLSSQEWHEGRHDVFPWLEYFYGVMIRAYKDFENCVGQFTGKGSKTEQVKNAIKNFVIHFSIKDIEKVCPNVSRDMIRKILRDLRDEGSIKSTGLGRAAKWQKK